MKLTLLLLLALISTTIAIAQTDTLVAHVYQWNNLEVKKDSSRDRSQVLDGKTNSLANLEIHASTLDPGKAPHPPHSHTDMEELVVVKEGKLKVTINGKSKTIGAGGIAVALPGDMHGFENGGNTRATYYVIKFKARKPMDADRGKQAGSSFITDWSELEVKQTDKGERRQVFDRPTALFSKFELHVTMLNAGQVSHDPHHHPNEEIILLRKGDAQMQIGNNFYRAGAGDLIFLSSEVLHALRNTGNGPCEYFALQWQ